MSTSNTISVVKIGGSTLGSQDTSLADVVALQQQGFQVVIVHGGGAAVTQWMAKLGIQAQFVEGLRVTDAPSLEVVTAVLAGLINKQLVAELLQLGGRAVGISGADGPTLRGHADRPELGFVASSVDVEPGPIRAIISAGYIPVIAPLAVNAQEGHQLLNLNADTAAGAIAVALGAAHLVFLTDVDGVLDNNGRLIPRLSTHQSDDLVRSGAIKGGMIPKLEASLLAAGHGARAHIINGTVPSALRDCMSGNGDQRTSPGTFIT